jgi:hypothetical protein
VLLQQHGARLPDARDRLQFKSEGIEREFCGCDMPDPSANSIVGESRGAVVEVDDVEGTEKEITGELRNTTSQTASFRIQFSLYDLSGAKVGTTSDRVVNLQPGERWRFKGFHMEPWLFQIPV